MTIEAFNWAKIQDPVVLLSDKEIGMTTESIDYNSLKDETPIYREVIKHDDPMIDKWKMYGFDSPEMIAKFAEVGGKVKVTATGSAHNAMGNVKRMTLKQYRPSNILKTRYRHTEAKWLE